MLARDMKWAQLVELAIYVAFAAWLHGRGGTLAASILSIPLLALASRWLIVCSMFVLAWIYRMKRAPAERIGVLAGAAMLLREYLAFLALNLLRTPWEHAALRPDPPEDAPGDVAIVLVHGYFANRACWKPLVSRLEAAGLGPVYVPSCRSHMASIESFEEDLNAAIERVGKGRRVALVAHSMGGLAARLHLARHGAAHVAKLVTISSPHHGTRLAPWGSGENARQMVPGSAFIAALEAHEARAAAPPTVAIYSTHDNMILPQDSARLPWARNVPVTGVGHIAQFADARVAERVIEALRAA